MIFDESVKSKLVIVVGFPAEGFPVISDDPADDWKVKSSIPITSPPLRLIFAESIEIPKQSSNSNSSIVLVVEPKAQLVTPNVSELFCKSAFGIGATGSVKALATEPS